MDERRFVVAEQDALVDDHAAPAARPQRVDHVLEEKHLGRAGLVGEVGLGLLALLATERRVHQHDIEGRRRPGEQPAIDLLAGQRVAVPDVRVVDAVQDQVRQRDRVDEIGFLAAEERVLA